MKRDRNHAREVLETALIVAELVAEEFMNFVGAIATVLSFATKTEITVIVRDMPAATASLCDGATAGIRWVLAIA